MRCKLYAPSAYHAPVEFWLILGPGSGYMRPWWVDLNLGPGNATKKGNDCGHSWPHHCNSAHCRNWWCGVSGGWHERGIRKVLFWFASGHRWTLKLPGSVSMFLRRKGWVR